MKKNTLLFYGAILLLTGLCAMALSSYKRAPKAGITEEKISVTTNSVTNITKISADVNFSVVVGQGVTLKGFGVCINKGPNPSVTTSKCWGPGKNSNRSGPNYTAEITGLTAGMKYYVRAYATTSTQTVYGKEMVFNTLPPK